MNRIFLVLIILCSGLSAWSQASPPVAYQPQMISYNGVPFGKCDIYQFAINTTNGNYYSCQNHTWTLIGGGGSPATDPLDCSKYAGGDVGAKWNACLAAAPAGSVLTFKNFTSPQVMTTAVNVNNGVWNDMAGLDITQQAGITVSTSAVISAGEFDQAFNGDQITITGAGVGLKNLTIAGDVGTNTGRGVVISGYDDTLETVAVSNHSGNEIEDSGGGLFGNANTIVNSIITYGGGAGISSSGADNISNTRISYGGSGTGNAILVHNTSFLSQVIVDSTSIYAGNPSAATAVSMTSAGSLTFAHGNIWASGYPAIDAPQGGLLIVTGNSINGGGVNGPIINHAIAAGVVTNSNNFVVANNILISPVPGSDGIDFAAGQGDQVSQNQITLPVQGFGSKCGIKLLTGISGMIDHNSIAITGGGTATGDNYGVCLVTISGAHMDQNMVTENSVTGQSSGNAHDRGYKFDNTANDAAPTFVSTNTFQLNNCADINICFDRLDATQNAITMYINNLDVATTSLFNAANGSTNDVIIEEFPGATFATLPVTGNGSRIYCNDCSSATAGGGSGLVLSRVNNAWTYATSQWASLLPGTNSTAGTFAMSGNTVDLHTAAHTLSTVRGTVLGIPATCTIGELYFATDATAGQNLYECQSTNVWTQQLNSGAAGASTSLGNLAAVAINASLVPAAANTVAVGSAAKPVTNIFLGTVATQAASFDTSSLSTNRTIKLPDAATVLPQAIAAVSHNFLTALSGTTGAFTQAQPTLADIAAGTAPSGTFDFSGVTLFKGRVGAGLTTSANGDFGYDTTNKNWHLWTNAADKIAAVWSATPTTGNCTQSSVAASVVLLADAGAPCGTWTNSSTSTGTNKTVDQEGSGNVITTVATGWLRAAGCNNASPAPSYDLPGTNAPTPNCLTGSNVTKATLDYDDSVNESAQFDIGLPHTWVGNIDINLKWLVTASGGANAVKWTVATSCSADAATYDTAFNAAQTITTNVAANNIQTVSSQTTLTSTGCAADNVLNVKIGRDTTDTFTGTARLIAAQLIYRHTGK